MDKDYINDLEKLRDSINIHRISAVQRQIKNPSDIDKFPVTKPKEKIKIMGLDKHMKKKKGELL